MAGDAGPKVITRAQWGADESIRCATPTIDDFIGGATVHHTAGSNDYSKSESAEIVRAIYAYHAQTLGWCDIGYNALVDKYGQIFREAAPVAWTSRFRVPMRAGSTRTPWVSP